MDERTALLMKVAAEEERGMSREIRGEVLHIVFKVVPWLLIIIRNTVYILLMYSDIETR